MTPEELKLFPDTRHESDEAVRQCQLVMIRMLHILDYLCRKHEIDYWIKDGTLLGAIRHKGFVPWDDDVDTAMTREHYNKFVESVVPELPDDIFFQSASTDSYYPKRRSVIAKLRDRYSCYEEIKQKRNLKWQMGLQIDICIYDRFTGPVHKRIYNTAFFTELRRIMQRTHKHFFPSTPLKSKWWCLNPANDWDQAVTYDDIFPLVDVEFEGIQVKTQNNWEGYLQSVYGNYNELIPENQRVPLMGHASAISRCDHPESRKWPNVNTNV